MTPALIAEMLEAYRENQREELDDYDYEEGNYILDRPYFLAQTPVYG